jgi:hypothetical protein
MKQGYTQIEAEALVNKLFETRGGISGVPRRTRGRVIEALDAGDHWNVLIEWELPHLATQVWYDKFDVQHSMHPIRPDWGQQAQGSKMDILEIRSSHDLAARSSDARRTGAHAYQVNCRQFTAWLGSWEKDKVLRAGPLGLMTLGLKQIWITAAESKRVAAAIEAERSPVALD